MAGSRRNFQYTDDLNAIYLFNADESNIEAVNGGSADIGAGNVSNPGIPRNIKPRRVYYATANRDRVLRIIAVTTAIYDAAPTTIPDPLQANDGDGNDLTLVQKVPETRRLFPNVDTGLDDGDNP